MYKSGLILGAAALLIAAVITVGIGPFCTPCFVLFLGLGAGYASGLFDKPLADGEASKVGAISGAIAGIGAVLGLSIGSAINGMVVGPEQALKITGPLIQSLGLPAMNPADYASVYWIALAGWALFCGIVDIIIMAAFGAAGALLWRKTTGKSATTFNP